MLLRVAYEGEGMGPLKLRWGQGGDTGGLKLKLCVGRIEEMISGRRRQRRGKVVSPQTGKCCLCNFRYLQLGLTHNKRPLCGAEEKLGDISSSFTSITRLNPLQNTFSFHLPKFKRGTLSPSKKHSTPTLYKRLLAINLQFYITIRD
jgi:hypothetical protein